MARLLSLTCLATGFFAIATASQGGAWKQPLGQGFASASLTLRQEKNAQQEELSYFGEYGVSEYFDLGLDLNQVSDVSGHAMVFTRLPLRQSPDGFQLSAALAAGANHYRGHWTPMYRFTLSAGSNFTTAHLKGWGNIDLQYEMRGDQDHPLWKLDANLGLHTAGRVAPMLSIETAKASGQRPSYTLIPSLRIKLDGLYILNASRPRRHSSRPGNQERIQQNSELLIGISYRHAERRSLGLKIALWHRF